MDGLTRASPPRALRGPLPLLLLVALAVRLALFCGGIRGSDAYAYAHHAYNLAVDRYDPTTETQYYGFRYAVLLPTALAYRLFGVSDWSSALFPLLASLGTLVLTVRLGREWLEPPTALLAGLLIAVFPLDIVNATLLGPSSFLPFLSAAAVLAGWRATRPSVTGRRRVALLLVSGVAIGLGVGAREVAALLLVPIGLFILVNRGGPRRLGALALVAVGFALPLAVEGLYYLRTTGDPLYRARVVAKLSEPFTAGPDPEGIVSLAYYPLGLLGLDREGLASFGFLGYLGIAAIVVAVRRPDRRLLPLAAWLGPVLGYLEFGSMSPTRYLPILKGYNYLSLVAVPLVLLAAWGLAALGSGPGAAPAPQGRPASWRRWVVAAIVAWVGATSLYGAWRLRENLADDARPYQVVARALEAAPERPVYVPHFRWALFLNYYLRYRTGFDFYGPADGRGRIRYVWEAPDAGLLPDAYVVVHDRYLYYDTKGRAIGRVEALPSFVFSPPSSWRVVVSERATPAYNSFILYETTSPGGLHGRRGLGPSR